MRTRHFIHVSSNSTLEFNLHTLVVARSNKTYDVLFKLRPFVHWLLWTATPVCGQREIGRFGVQDLGSGRVDVRWERGACAVALVLRADILTTTGGACLLGACTSKTRKRVSFHHPVRNARIAFRVSKTGNNEKRGYQIHSSPEQVWPTIRGNGKKFGSDTLVRARCALALSCSEAVSIVASSPFRVPFREWFTRMIQASIETCPPLPRVSTTSTSAWHNNRKLPNKIMSS